LIRTRFALTALCAGLLALTAGVAGASAATITVDSSGDEYNNIPASTGCTLREAVQAANTDAAFGGCLAGSGSDVIELQVDVNLAIDGETSQAGDLDVLEGLIVDGAGGPGGRAHIASDTEDRVFTASADLTLQDLEISGGDVPEEGEPNDGGAVLSQGAAIEISRSHLHGNHAEEGGAVFSEGPVEVFDSEISNNTAVNYSGAIGMEGNDLTIDQSTIAGNQVLDDDEGGFGGGIGQYAGGTLNMDNSTVSGNSAPAGGGIAFANAAGMSLNIENSTIAGNVDTVDGDFDAGGLLVLSATTGVTIYSTLLAGNTAQGAPSNCASEAAVNDGLVNTYNLETANTCGFGAVGSNDRLNASADLAPLADNGGPTRTHALYTGSAAIDAIPALVPSCASVPVDQRDVARPVGGSCDIGAFEGAVAKPPTGGGAPVPTAPAPPAKKCKKPKKKSKKAKKKFKKCKKRLRKR
jgi:CSLREA domain-containing protein